MSTLTSSKNHVYPNSFRSINLVNALLCQDKVYLYITPPENSLLIENLYVHIKLTFFVGVAVADRVVKYVGIANEVPLFIATDPDYLRYIELDVAANANREVELRLDLTHLLKKDNVGYQEYFQARRDDLTLVIIKVADNNRGVTNIATINQWKVDAQWTTEGIASKAPGQE